jgi:hypothetical protein
MKTKITVLLFFAFGFAFSQVGVNTDTPLSMLDINGNLSLKVVNYNGGPTGGAATPINDGIYINLEPLSSNLDFILPNAAAFPGRIYILRNITDAHDARIFSSGGTFFAGNSNGSTAAPIVMEHVGGGGESTTKTLIFISDGINWTYGHLGFN